MTAPESSPLGSAQRSAKPAERDVPSEAIARELLPCPFCGSDAGIDSTEDNSEAGIDTWMVCCGNGSCHGNAFSLDSRFTSRKMAVKNWNSRYEAAAIQRGDGQDTQILNALLDESHTNVCVIDYSESSPRTLFNREDILRAIHPPLPTPPAAKPECCTESEWQEHLASGAHAAAKPNETSGATPRTDAEVIENFTASHGEKETTCFPHFEIVRADFARELERELVKVRDNLTDCEITLGLAMAQNENMDRDITHLKAELNAVRAAGAEACVEFIEVGLDGRRIPHTTDAKVWASEFVKTITASPSIASDVDTMLGWFANAMCAQMDESERRHAAKSTPGVAKSEP